MMADARGAGEAGDAASSTAFQQPLQLLAEWHGRLQECCAALLRLQGQLAAGGDNDLHRAAAGALRRDVDALMGCLHQDEEQDLFPALLESMAGSDAVCIRQMIEARVDEHREIEARWLGLRQWLEAVEAGQAAAPEAGSVAAFGDCYLSHLTQEDGELLPMAERLLSDEALALIGDGMRRRHGAA
jgi:hypothetical protein